MIIITIIICVLAFFVGLLLGISNRKYHNPINHRKPETKYKPFDEEIINFLKYDGTKQI